MFYVGRLSYNERFDPQKNQCNYHIYHIEFIFTDCYFPILLDNPGIPQRCCGNQPPIGFQFHPHFGKLESSDQSGDPQASLEQFDRWVDHHWHMYYRRRAGSIWFLAL